MIDFSQKFDGVINIITAIAIIYYAVFMNVSEKNTGRRKRLMLLFTLLGSFCLIRGFNYLFNLGIFIEVVVLFISSFIPFSLFLLIELLIRRHLPLLLKIFISLSTITLSLLVLIFGVNKYVQWALMGNYIISLLSFAFVLLLNKDLDLQKNEQRLIKLLALISILAIPLIVTDFKKSFGWETIRFGAVGVLFFLYSLVKIWETTEIKSGLLKLFSLLIFNLASAAIISYVFDIFHFYLHVFTIFIMLRMLADIIIYSSDSYHKKAQDLTLNVIDLFLASDLKFDAIKKNSSDKEYLLVHRSELPNYKTDRFINIFNKSGLYLKNEIKKLTSDLDVMDEVVHLFEDFDCNACIFVEIPLAHKHTKSERNFYMVLFKWPELAPVHKLEREIILIQSLASHLKE